MYGDLTYSDYTVELEAKRRPLVREVVSMLILFSDLIAISAAFLLSMLASPLLKNTIFSGDTLITMADYARIHDAFFVWMCPLALLMFFIKGHYTQRVPWWSQVQHVLVISIFGFVIDGFMRMAMQASFSLPMILISWVLVFLFILIGRQLVHSIARKKDIWDIPTVLIGDTETVTDTLFAFANDDYTGYQVHTIFLRDNKAADFDLANVPAKYGKIRVVSNSLYYTNYIENNLDHFYVVALETFRGAERDTLINNLNRLRALYAVVPPISRLSLYEMEPRYFFGHDVMLLHSKQAIFAPLGRSLKRAMDIAVSGTALFLLSPVILGVSVMLKIEGQGGSLFYGGYRIGRYGQRFRCWKFRSMEPNSDNLLEKVLAEDPATRDEWEK